MLGVSGLDCIVMFSGIAGNRKDLGIRLSQLTGLDAANIGPEAFEVSRPIGANE